MRSIRLWTLVAALLALAPLPLSAQSVEAVVVQAGTGQPLTGSLVVLLDPAGRQVTGAVTGSDGRAMLYAMAPGTYRIRVERVGFSTALTPAFDLAVGEALARRVELPIAVFQLEGLVARGSRRCVLRPEEGTAMNRVWEEARKALNASAWTDALGLVQYSAVSYKRDLDRETHRVLREEAQPRTGRGVRPYASRPAAELAARGYVRPDGDGWMHYGPDAEVLLSDEFLDTHCFRVKAGTGGNQGQIGLAFEPMKDTRLPDVKGVLWLDAKSVELRTLDFDYTNLPRGYGDGRRAGGRVEFERLPNGIWIVRRWWIRADRMQQQTRLYRGETLRNLVVTAIEETGGEVVDVRVAGNAVGASTRAVLEGSVAYPGRERVPVGTEVFLLGTPYRAAVDSLGHFRMADLPAGLYSIALAHPLLRVLGAAPEAQEVTLQPEAPARVEFEFPSQAAAVRAACPAPKRYADGLEVPRGLVFGAVSEAESNAPMANIRVLVGWSTFEYRRGSRLTAINHLYGETSGPDGRFLLCGVPLERPAEVRLSDRNLGLPPVQFRLDDDPVLEQNFRVPRRATR
jgi:hypothetical protein